MEMLPGAFRPKAAVEGLEVVHVQEPYAELAKFMHILVGHPWRWGGRKTWTASDWETHVSDPNYVMLLAQFSGSPVGYSEMATEETGDVQIHTMGLAPQFVGKGLGGAFLSAVVAHAWTLTSTRVWLSTCSHDHPHARANYEARGFKVFETVEGDDNPSLPGFWDLVADRGA